MISGKAAALWCLFLVNAAKQCGAVSGVTMSTNWATDLSVNVAGVGT